MNLSWCNRCCVKKWGVTTRINIILIGISITLSVKKITAQPNLIWAKQSETGTAFERAFDIAVDDMGNVYSVGQFSGAADFDSGAGTTTLTSAGGFDIFILKLNANGDFLWVKQIGSTSTENAQSVFLDGLGGVYVSGNFNGTVDFDPGLGIFNLTSSSSDMYFLKLDINGNFIWVKKFGGTNGDDARNLVTDNDGNLYATGYFTGTVNFGGGNLVSSGSFDIFVVKFDPLGNHIWSRKYGTANTDQGNGIALDVSNNVYVTGFFRGTIDFGGGNLVSFGTTNDIFVLKLDASGNHIWSKQMGGTSVDNGFQIATDGSGVFVTGAFAGTADFNPSGGGFPLTSVGGDDIFVVKLDLSSNFLWAHRFGDTSQDQGKSVITDQVGNVYVTGVYRNTVDFDPGATTFNLTSDANTTDAFVLKLDASGGFIFVFGIDGPDSDQSHAIAYDDMNGNIYVTGQFRSTADFDPSGSLILTAPVQDAMFVAKYFDTAPPLPVTLLTFEAECDYIHKTVQLSWQTVSEINNHFFTIERSADALNFETIGIIEGSGNSNIPLSYVFLDKSPESKTSYYRLKQTDFNGEYEYFHIKAIECSFLTEQALVYPTVAKIELNIAYKDIDDSQGIEINIIDISGKLVKHFPLSKITNNNKVIDISDLSNGLYILVINNYFYSQRVKFIKQ